MMRMIDKELSDRLMSLFGRYLSFYKDFLDLEIRKYGDMRENRLETLNGHVNDEQAHMLKARGLELERERLMHLTPFPDATFRELIPLFDESVREQAQAAYEELSGVLIRLKETNQKCNYLTELKLHRVKIELKKLENNPEMQKIYDSRAKEGKKPGSILSRKA